MGRRPTVWALSVDLSPLWIIADDSQRYANHLRLSRAAKGPQKEPIRSAVFPFSTGLARSRETATAKLREEPLGVGPECIRQVNLPARAKMSLEEFTQRRVARGVVDDLGAENDVEIGRQ